MNLAAAISHAGPRNDADQLAPSFRTLLGEAAWARLAKPIQKRFGDTRAAGNFTGSAQLEANIFGHLIARLMVLAGRPLPTVEGQCAARVTLKPGPGGVVWDRAYQTCDGGWQHVRSVKRQTGTTLFECAGPVWMRLRLTERAGALCFISTGFLVALGPVRFRLPDWLTPGHLVVTHTDHGGGDFSFTLICDHPVFGRVFDQSVILHDNTPKEGA